MRAETKVFTSEDEVLIGKITHIKVAAEVLYCSINSKSESVNFMVP